MIKEYRKLPVKIKALQWSGINKREMYEFLGASVEEGKAVQAKSKHFFIDYGNVEDRLMIKTLEGDMHVNHGDYVIMGITGEFYPCKPEIFEKTYEEVK